MTLKCEEVFVEERKVISRSEARALGLNRYFTGKPCKWGHVAERRIEGKCVECVKEDIIKNAKIYTERASLWQKNNKERIKLWRDKNYRENLEIHREKSRKYKKENPEIARKAMAKWKLKQENREKLRAWWANRRARKSKINGSFLKSDVDSIFQSQNFQCAACSVDLKEKKFHVDHIKPLAKGGSNWPWNLQILCPQCNMSKSSKDYEEWKASKFKCE